MGWNYNKIENNWNFKDLKSHKSNHTRKSRHILFFTSNLILSRCGTAGKDKISNKTKTILFAFAITERKSFSTESQTSQGGRVGNGEICLQLVFQRSRWAGKHFLVQQRPSLLHAMRKSFAFAVRGRYGRKLLLRFLAIEIRLPRHSASKHRVCLPRFLLPIGRALTSGCFYAQITRKTLFSVVLASSAMNHCICWRWKMPKKIRMASSVWAIYWIYGSATGVAERRNSTSISFGLTIILKYFPNFKFHRFPFKVISYCRRWLSFGRSRALLFFIITQILLWKWFIS